MQELDHIVRYCETRDDSRENLQMLCACCHAAKSRAEQRAGKSL
jgi:5-methylcytosine-specific restriction endonuclease McrA